MSNKSIIFMMCFCFMAVFAFFGCSQPEPPKPNSTPIISSLTAEPQNISAEKASVITCVATDADGDSLIYEWSAASGTIKGEGNKAEYIAPTSGGIYVITVKVTDGKGGMIQKTTDITINSKPTVVLKAEEQEIEVSSKTKVACEASDTDNDTLTITWSATSGTIQDSGATAIFTAPDSVDTCVITVKVTDGKEEITESISITTKQSKKGKGKKGKK